MSNIVVRKGDLWQLGPHRVICDDCTNPSVVEKLCDGAVINSVITDPPYGVDYVSSKKGLVKLGGEHEDIKNDQTQSESEYTAFSNRWIQPILTHLADKNSWYVFNSDKMLFALKQALDASHIKFGQLLIWVKSQPVIGRLDYLPQHELIVYGWHGTHTFHKSKDKSVIFCPKPNKNRLHPTMKPVSLLRRLILNSTRLGDIVYDPFGGSGSTLLACGQTRRRCLTAEIDPKYCQVIIERYEKLTGEKAIKL